MSAQGWIGVDLDGTLAQYGGWKGAGHVGEPVPAMQARVKAWLAEGRDVRIFTARVGPQKSPDDVRIATDAIQRWCALHLGRVLPITCTKDYACVEIWDDRAVQVVPNTGMRADGQADEYDLPATEIRVSPDLHAEIVKLPHATSGVRWGTPVICDSTLPPGTWQAGPRRTK